MSDPSIEQEIRNKGLTAPRVTPVDIEANIASEHYFTAMDGVIGYADSPSIVAGTPINSPLDLLTFCVIVMKNGFTVTGESACASPENFDEQIGRKIARANAVQKIWPLMGYMLRERLFREQRGDTNQHALAQEQARRALLLRLFDIVGTTDENELVEKVLDAFSKCPRNDM